MDESNISTTSHCRSNRGRKSQRKADDKCLVCGSPSIGMNFGVHTCSPCKAFFRRNAVKLGTHEFTCRKDGDCPITNNSRRNCNCCRLAKCFRVGMDRHAIRSKDERLARQRLLEHNRQKRAEIDLAIQPVHLFKDSSLSSTDQEVLTNIFSAYEQTCISFRYDEHLKMPNDDSLSLQRFMNSLSHMYISFVDYFKLIPEFRNLPVDVKISQLKKNFNQIFRLNSALVIHATGVVDDVNSVVFKRVFPDDLYSELCVCVISLLPFSMHAIQCLETFIQTEGSSSVQNYYIELLWRYLLYRCSTYRESVRLLISFITCLLRSQIVNEKLATYVSQTVSNQVDQLEPIMKAMWLSERK